MKEDKVRTRDKNGGGRASERVERKDEGIGDA